MNPLRFPTPHWTVTAVEAAVAELDRLRACRVSIHAADVVRPEVLSAVEPWLVLAVPDAGVRVFVPGEGRPRLFVVGDAPALDDLVRKRWLPDARAWLLREAGYSPALELEPPAPVTGAELEAARRAAGITQTVLAALVGVSAQVLQRWEAGTRRIPPERAQRLREILGTTWGSP